ncbi:putative transmembrane protein [Toxoplasma gondii CAST]|uniref:Putative transmembrane protein n=1 Tax=Toxoplasma gondii CAST TaxID=943122 RepID=A0A425I1M2_TOXGO|nr:putative transmembrane protein [Toxoplasma gondii CAST]
MHRRRRIFVLAVFLFLDGVPLRSCALPGFRPSSRNRVSLSIHPTICPPFGAEDSLACVAPLLSTNPRKKERHCRRHSSAETASSFQVSQRVAAAPAQRVYLSCFGLF